MKIRAEAGTTCDNELGATASGGSARASGAQSPRQQPITIQLIGRPIPIRVAAGMGEGKSDVFDVVGIVARGLVQGRGALRVNVPEASSLTASIISSRVI